MDHMNVAKQILERVGGAQNVETVIHCMTRLRFTLKDESMVDDELVKKTKGVMGIMKKGGQYQIIIGNDVARVHKEIMKLGNFKDETATKKQSTTNNQGFVSAILDVLSSCVSPVIPALIATAMIKVLLTILPMLGLLTPSSQTYQLLSIIGDGSFYFMPILIAASAAKKFNTNMYLAISLAAIMVHPSFVELMNSTELVKFIGIPVVKASYAYSVIPVILGTWVLSYVERFVDKITPSLTKNFLKPLLILLIAAPLVLMTVGPIGAIAGEFLSTLVYTIQDKIGWLAVALIAGFMPFIVMTGMHHAFTPVKLANLAVPGGYEALMTVAELCSNLAQGSAAMAVAFRTKNKELKEIAFSAGFSALVGGITEPTMYGVTLRLKRPMLAACLASGTAGIFAGIMKLKCFGVATPALVTLVQYVDANNAQNIIIAIATAALTIVLSFIFTLIIGFEDPIEEVEETVVADSNNTLKTAETIASPLEGIVVGLNEVNDNTFSSEALGKGIAVMPTVGKVYAPFDGTVEAFFHTHHAIGLKSTEGVEVLIHVGLETVNLKGQYFTPQVKMGDKVKKGQLLLEFDLEKIVEAGYEMMTPIVITNTNEYMDVVSLKEGNTKAMEALLSVV